MTDPLLQDRVVAAVGDRYEVERELGRGAMSVVYLGRDVRLRRAVAIKVLPPEFAFRADVRARFLREAQTAARLAHAHIVPIYAVEDAAGIACYVMPFIDGETLGQRLQREPRPPLPVVLRVLREVADALAHAHAHGVVHRDVKPDNVLLERAGGRALVTDFGIARAAEGDASLTVTGVAVGSPAYMSPEQALGEREVDGRADVYGLGVMAFQMLAGRLPFQATSTPAMLMKHVSEAPPPLAPLRPDVPAALVAVVERALAKKPADRWPDALALRDAIAAVERGEAPAVSAAPPAPPASSRAAAGTPPSGAGFAVLAPVNVPVPVAPAPPMPAVPPMPAFPAFPVSGGREAREAWREAARAWREQLQAQRHEFVAAQRAWQAEARADAREARGGYAWTSTMVAPGRNAAAFRRNFITYAMVIGGLAMLNAATSPEFPWVIFPAAGWGFGLLGHAGSLRRQGVRPWEAITGRAAVEQEALAGDVGREGMPAVERRVTAFRRALVRAAVFTITAAVSVAGLIATEAAPLAFLLAGSVIGGVVSAAGALSRGIGLRRLGISWRDAWRGTWREQLTRHNPALAGRLMDVEVKRLLPADVQEGPYGQVVRDAAADRAAILETMARLGDADRALLPDVVPTVQGLEERIVTLATSLHRLSRDVSGGQVAQLDARLAEAERRPDGADRERTLALLRRQRETLADLLERRQTLETQLDGAVLLLQTIKLDLLRLRSAGVQSALHDVTSATQEARALSRDIGTALAVADELRAV